MSKKHAFKIWRKNRSELFDHSSTLSLNQTIATSRHNTSQHRWPSICKLRRPNGRNISTQHIVTLLGATRCARFATLMWRVDTLGIGNRTSTHARGRLTVVRTCQTTTTPATSTNVVWKIYPFLNLSQRHPASCNMSQHILRGWPNTRNMLRPTKLWSVALKCCDRLAGA